MSIYIIKIDDSPPDFVGGRTILMSNNISIVLNHSFPTIFLQGQCQDPGRVFKGKKMPGRMGGVRVTKQNLRIIKIDRGRNLIYLKGAVPGNKGEFVEIRDAVKRPLFGTEKCEGGKDSAFPPLPTFEYEEGVDGTGEAGHEVMMPMQEQDPLEIVESDAD